MVLNCIVPGFKRCHNTLDAPTGYLDKTHGRIQDKTFGKIDFLTLPRCYNSCPNGGWDTARRIHQGNLNDPDIMMEAAEQVSSEGYEHVSLLIALSVMVGTDYRTHTIDVTSIPTEAMNGGHHKCGCCLDYPTSGAIPKWRCELCNYYPTSGNGVRTCNGGPEAAPRLYNSDTTAKIEPFCVKLKDDNRILSIFTNNAPQASFHRETWANSFPCRYYERRSRAPKQPAPITNDERRADDWFKARFHAGVTITEYLEASNNITPEREYLITALTVRLPNINREIIESAVDSAFNDILKTKQKTNIADLLLLGVLA